MSWPSSATTWNGAPKGTIRSGVPCISPALALMIRTRIVCPRAASRSSSSFPFHHHGRGHLTPETLLNSLPDNLSGRLRFVVIIEIHQRVVVVVMRAIPRFNDQSCKQPSRLVLERVGMTVVPIRARLRSNEVIRVGLSRLHGVLR